MLLERSSGARAIAEERSRQIGAEGYDQWHDDDHDRGQLAMAAVCYAACAAGRKVYVKGLTVALSDPWPWDKDSDKRPEGRPPTREESIRLLEKAGALIAAEIDRLVRNR